MLIDTSEGRFIIDRALSYSDKKPIVYSGMVNEKELKRAKRTFKPVSLLAEVAFAAGLWGGMFGLLWLNHGLEDRQIGTVVALTGFVVTLGVFTIAVACHVIGAAFNLIMKKLGKTKTKSDKSLIEEFYVREHHTIHNSHFEPLRNLCGSELREFDLLAFEYLEELTDSQRTIFMNNLLEWKKVNSKIARIEKSLEGKGILDDLRKESLQVLEGLKEEKESLSKVIDGYSHEILTKKENAEIQRSNMALIKALNS